MPGTDPETRSPASIKIPTKRTSGGHQDCLALNDAFTKNLLWIETLMIYRAKSVACVTFEKLYLVMQRRNISNRNICQKQTLKL